ncbi:MAG: RNA polymerase sigma factor RpoD/SigA [Sandaracinaceae bacterium]
MLDAQTERTYLKALQSDSDPTAALDALLTSHLRLVLSVARKYASHGVPIEDLVAEGNLGLVEAARRFDPSRDNRFATYAAWWVRALIRRYTIANRRIVGAPSTRNARRLLSSLRKTERRLAQQLGQPPSREQVANELDVAPSDVAMMDAALRGRDVSLGPGPDGGPAFEVPDVDGTPEDRVEESERAAHNAACIEGALELLDAREREIVERRLLSEDRETLARIGLSLGLSRERVRQIEKRACEKLRTALHEKVA